MMSAKRACAMQPSSGSTTEQLPFCGGRLHRVFDTKTTHFLVSVLPQFEGSPALQSLIMGFLFLTTGTATILLKTMLGAPLRYFFAAKLKLLQCLQAGSIAIISCAIYRLGSRVRKEIDSMHLSHAGRGAHSSAVLP
jgi:hypothetical protein